MLGFGAEFALEYIYICCAWHIYVIIALCDVVGSILLSDSRLLSHFHGKVAFEQGKHPLSDESAYGYLHLKGT